jgi:hypothetical protein
MTGGSAPAEKLEVKPEGAQAILDVLDARRIGVTPHVSARIAVCTGPALLERWLVHAATCVDAASFARAID